MTSWDGRGLPPVAAARVARFQSSPLRTSLLSVPASVGLDSAGFDPVGEVMGCIVQQISWVGYAGCGAWTGPGASGWGAALDPRTMAVQPSTGSFYGYGPYVHAIETGYSTALGRMLMEASALGADGVVGVRLTDTHLDHARGTREFMAIGTAVRGRTRIRPKVPFTTDLPGTDVAKLLMSGWAPVALQVALEVAIRHDDYATRNQARSRLFNTANVEVAGYTELVQHTRSLARDKLARAVGRVGADGGVVSDMRLRIWEIEPSEGHIDHAAEATIVGTAIAAFGPLGTGRTAPPAPLTIMPTRGKQVPKK
jgi:uncharacterized protein YbjQ (UPF0145 family)